MTNATPQPQDDGLVVNVNNQLPEEVAEFWSSGQNTAKPVPMPEVVIPLTPIEQLKKLVEETFGSLKSPDEIAQLCRERQIKGFQGNFTSCPMVKLIREQVDFQVGFTMGKKLGSGNWSWVTYNKMVAFQSPMVCDEFSDNFDIGKYPDLIAFPKKEEATES